MNSMLGPTTSPESLPEQNLLPEDSPTQAANSTPSSLPSSTRTTQIHAAINLTSQSDSQETKPSSTVPTRTYDRRTLIVDDNDSNLLLLRFAMQMGTMPFDEADNGTKTLDLWSKGNYSFAILDIELPDINGLELARRIRAEDNGIVIIMCSTNDDPFAISEASKCDCDGFIVKPLQLDVVLSLIKTMDREKMRTSSRMTVIDNGGRQRTEARHPRRTTATMKVVAPSEVIPPQSAQRPE